ncbi:MAG: bifunctional diguanylate cyclase/phosphodiesterase [Bacillota bacterium]
MVFWEGQSDYIILLYGLSLIFMTAVCFSLNKEKSSNLPWIFLFWFGVLHGTYQMLELLAYSIGSGTGLAYFSNFLLIGSFLFLIEFGRSGIKNVAGKAPGRWIYIPLAVVFALGLMAGPEGLNAASRYGFGLTGGMLTAAAIILSGKESPDLSRLLKPAGLGLGFFALLIGVGPKAGFIPALIINKEAFFQLVKMPIEMILWLVIFFVSMYLWLYQMSLRDKSNDLPVKNRRKMYTALIVTNVFVILGLGWAVTHYWGNYAYGEIKENNRSHINHLALILKSELTEAERGAVAMSGSPWIAPALTNGNPQDIERANSVLNRYKGAMKASACFLLDIGGKVVASSDMNSSDSLMGYHGSQPYFLKAINGGTGWSLETEGKIGQRSYYTGYPVRDHRSQIVGVAVIKKDLGSVEREFSSYYYCFFVDQEGFIYLSSRGDMQFKSLWPQDDVKYREAILPSNIQDGSHVTLNGQRYIVNRLGIGPEGWSIVLLGSLAQVWVYRLFCIFIVLVLCVLTMVFYTALMSVKESSARISISERRYHSLVEGSPNWVKIIDTDGRFVSINRSGLDAMGWSHSQIIGKRFREVWPEESQPLVDNAVEQVMRGMRCSFEATCYRSDGTPLIWFVSLYPIYEDEGNILNFVGISTNMTERRKAEEALRESETKFRTLYDSANDAIIIMDGLQCIDCNPRALEMFQCDRKQIIGHLLPSFSPPKQPDGFSSEERARLLISEVLNGEPRYFQWTQRRLDGKLFETEISLNRIKLKDRYYLQAIIRDITERKNREEQLRLHAAALQSAANAVVITDLEGRITWVNPAFSGLTGYRADDVIGKKMSFLKSGIQEAGFYRELWKTIFDGRVWHGEMQNRHKNGNLYIEEQTITPVRDEDGRITHFVAIKQDVTKRKQQEQQLSYLATHDPLTNLPNRRVLEDSLRRAVAKAGRGNQSCLLFMDLDNFKIVNDTLGHTAGDQVLYNLTHLIQSLLRTGDLLARFGGDEFAVLLEGVGIDKALSIAERMRREVEEHRFVVGDQNFHLTLSIGLVVVDGEYEQEAVLSQADTAMYLAKDHGRNRVIVYRHEDGVMAKLTEVNKWTSRIKAALADDRFVLYFQPLVRVSNDSVDHYEALIRMIGEDGAIIPPGAFIPVAERYGLMPQLDRWVFKQVINKLQKNPGIKVFMNLSGSSLAEETFSTFVEEQVKQSGIDPGCLGFEITETAVVQDLVAAEKWVRRIKALGCRFALDDFGAGFNSFIYLHSLPVDQIKIDGYYIRTLESDPTRCALVQAMHALARTLGMETVAEFVENEEILKIIKNIGITYGQGYHIDKPIPDLPSGE